MYLLPCLLSVTFLSTAVSAFYPYNFPDDQDSSVRRFIPFLPFDSEEDGENSLPTLHLKKGPSLVGRENNYDVVLGSPPTMPNSMAINNDGRDYSYFSVVKVGSEGQKMWLLLDTGASKTWVMGTDCTTKSCLAHNTFGKEDSTTLEVMDEEWEVTYGTGDVEGVMVKDSMSFAGFDLDLKFGSASDASEHFLNYPMDGILGLGLADPDSGNEPTVMQVMMDEGLLDLNVLGVNLQRNSDNATDGQITFGGVDTSKFSGSLTYASVLPDVHRWEIPIDDAILDGTSAGFTGKSAIVDTGTSFILMPSEDAKIFHDSIPGAIDDDGETYRIPCSTSISVKIVISSTNFSVSSKDYVGVSDGSGEMCHSNIAGHKPFGEDQWLLGDVFLKNVYTVFDFDRTQIGFGKRLYADSPSTSQGIFNPSAVPTATSTATVSSLPGSSETNTPESGDGEDEDGAAPGISVPVSFMFVSFLATSGLWLATGL